MLMVLRLILHLRDIERSACAFVQVMKEATQSQNVRVKERVDPNQPRVGVQTIRECNSTAFVDNLIVSLMTSCIIHSIELQDNQLTIA